MPKIPPRDVITQQLNALSLVELLEIRAEVDALIEKKASPINKDQQASPHIEYYSVLKGSYRGATSVSSETTIDLLATETSEPRANNKKDNSLEKVIGLVNEWMADESGYDERVYPEIEAGLNQNRLSL